MRTLRTACILFGVCASYTIFAASAAAAAPPGKRAGAPSSIPIAEVIRQAKPAAIPARLGAHHRELQPRGRSIGVPGSGPVLESPAERVFGPLALNQNGAWPGAYNAVPNAQIGKLYYDVQPGAGAQWRVCSGTVVYSENKALVVTAGHCVYKPDPDGDQYIQGNGYWYEDFRFCPGYEYACKLGDWLYHEAFTTTSWYSGTGTPARYDWSDDMGVILLKPNTPSGLIMDAVGAQGISFNWTTGLNRHAMGYPGRDERWPEYTYDGGDLIYCPAVDGFDGYRLAIACTMTGGASGGPWITQPDANWYGYVNSVNSHKPWGGEFMGGPYFGDAEASLFAYTRARPVPATPTPPPPPAPAPPPPPPSRPPAAATCRVPKVVGRTLATARKRIRQAKCKVGSLRRKRSGARQAGKVLRQTPAAGKTGRAGMKVNLILGRR